MIAEAAAVALADEVEAVVAVAASGPLVVEVVVRICSIDAPCTSNSSSSLWLVNFYPLLWQAAGARPGDAGEAGVAAAEAEAAKLEGACPRRRLTVSRDVTVVMVCSMKGGAKVVVEPHRHPGVFIARGKEDALVTLNMNPGKAVYQEKLIKTEVG